MTTNNNFLMEMAEQMKQQGTVLYESIKYVDEVAKEVRQSKEDVMKVGNFLLSFYNEYHDHKELDDSQADQIQEAQHIVTTNITKILNPRLPESRTRGSEYYREWIKVNKGIWSIFKYNVNNGLKVPYHRTPRIKFEQALDYMRSLDVSDYLAYRDGRWRDIKKFTFDDTLVENKLSIEEIIGDKKGRLLISN